MHITLMRMRMMVAHLNLILITMFDAVSAFVCLCVAMWIYDGRQVFRRGVGNPCPMHGWIDVWLVVAGWILVRWVVPVELVFGLAQ